MGLLKAVCWVIIFLTKKVINFDYDWCSVMINITMIYIRYLSNFLGF